MDWLEAIETAEWVRVELPMPPSVNGYWKKYSRGVYLSPEAKRFRDEVTMAVRDQEVPKFRGPVMAMMAMHWDWRACDLDNYEKGMWDALQLCGVLYNDCQVSCVLRFWGEPRTQRGITLSLASVTDLDLVKGLPGWTNQQGGSDSGRKKRSRKQSATKPKASRQPRIRRVGAETDDQ